MYVDPTGMNSLANQLAQGIVFGAILGTIFQLFEMIDPTVALHNFTTFLSNISTFTSNGTMNFFGFVDYSFALIAALEKGVNTGNTSRWGSLPEEERAAFWGAVWAGAGLAAATLLSGGTLALPIVIITMAGGAATGYYVSLIEQLVEELFF